MYNEYRNIILKTKILDCFLEKIRNKKGRAKCDQNQIWNERTIGLK